MAELGFSFGSVSKAHTLPSLPNSLLMDRRRDTAETGAPSAAQSWGTQHPSLPILAQPDQGCELEQATPEPQFPRLGSGEL